jgi:hypothetical protein
MKGGKTSCESHPQGFEMDAKARRGYAPQSRTAGRWKPSQGFEINGLTCRWRRAPIGRLAENGPP